MEIVHLLHKAGSVVQAYDPYAAKLPPDGIQLVPELFSAIKQTDILVVLVGHAEFKQIDTVLVEHLNPQLICFDAVNIWRSLAWQQSGISLFHLGNGKESGPAR